MRRSFHKLNTQISPSLRSFFTDIKAGKNGLAVHILISSLLFSIYCIWFRTGLIADDNRYLWLSLQDNFSFWDMGANISRTPVHTAIFYGLIKIGYLQSAFFPLLILLFGIHSASVYLISKKLISLVNGEEPGDAKSARFLAFALILFSFHPNFMEVIFMAMSAAGVFGALFMALSLNSRRFFPVFIFSLLSFGTYESFILPVFSFSLLPIIAGKADKSGIQAGLKKLFPSLLALLCFLAFRYVFSLKAGAYQQPMTLDWYQNIGRVLRYYFGVFTKGYDSENSNYFELGIPLLVSLMLAAKSGYGSLRKVHLLLLLGLASCAIDLVVPYDGIRVIYGSYFIKAGAVLALFQLLLRKYHSAWFLLFCTMLLPVYLLNLVSIYNIRQLSFHNQKNIERLVSGIMLDEEPAKTLLVPGSGVHLHHADWTLEQNSTIQYKLYRFIHTRTKDMDYKVIGFDSLGFSDAAFPLFYPARSFVYQYGPKWESDDSSKTGEIFHVGKGFYGLATWGPYLRLDSGRYEVEIVLKTDSSIKNMEFGDLTISDTAGKQPYGFFPFRSADFPVGKYRPLKCRFQLPAPSTNLELKIFSNGICGFKVDYMRIWKLRPED